MAEPTYIFKDGHVYTMVEGQVVASVKESEFEPGQTGGPEVEMPEAPAGVHEEERTCPNCLNEEGPDARFCSHCGANLEDGSGAVEGPDEGWPPAGQTVAQTVTTPNGMKGKVLARVPGLWGEEVTVRFENGNIVKVPVDKSLTFAAAEEDTAQVTPAGSLDARLCAHYERDKMNLVARGRELQAISREAAQRIAAASDEEAQKLSALDTEARYELAEITAALDAINQGETEAFEAPRSIPHVTQASMNKNDASWLDGVYVEMVHEASERDYKELMDTGPEAFVASLDVAQLGDAATTRIMATREIEAKTAGADQTHQDAYRRLWLARVEEQRKVRLASHKEEVRKEASADTPSAPDESLFL